MRRPKPVQKPIKPLPQIGDFIVRDAYDGKCGAHVALKTGPRWDDYKTSFYCRTDHGAQKLADLMNAAKDLARNYHQIRDEPPYGGGNARLYVLSLLASAVQEATGGPQPELYYEFLQRLDTQRCEACKPAPISCEAA